jgi:hypothetical protein
MGGGVVIVWGHVGPRVFELLSVVLLSPGLGPFDFCCLSGLRAFIYLLFPRPFGRKGPVAHNKIQITLCLLFLL